MISSFVRRALLAGTASVVFLSALSCSQTSRRPEPTDLYWPPLPDRPRIHYIESIYKGDDVGRVSSLKETLFEKTYATKLARPSGVYVRRWRLLVSDVALRTVFVFDLATKRVSIIGTEGGLILPSAAVQSADGTIYVVDAGAGKVLKYDSHGSYVTALPLQLEKPVGMTIDDSRGRLYIVDRALHEVIVGDLDGRLLFSFGGQGVKDGKFNIPLDAALDREGRIYVLDSGNFRVQCFTPDGEFLYQFGSAGDRPGTFANPKGIALDSEGHVYVTDAAFSNFQMFDAAGAVRLQVGQLGSLPGQFNLPGGISIDEHDRIYIADQLNGRIEIFQHLGSGPAPTQP